MNEAESVRTEAHGRSLGGSGGSRPIEVPPIPSNPSSNAFRSDAVATVAKGRIAQLDGWRGVSILFVITGHLLNSRYSSLGPLDYPFPIAALLASWGVDIFFVISGFIITKLALSERDTTGSFSTRAFYVRRFFRIIPPFFLYLAFIILVTSAGLISQSQSDTLLAATFTCNLPLPHCGWFAGHSWTLAYEEQFYLIFPLLFALSGRRARLVFVALFILLVSFPFLRHLLQLGAISRAIAGFLPSFVFICAGSVMAAYEPVLKQLSDSQCAVYLTYLATGCVLGLILFLRTSAEPGSPSFYLQASLSITILPVSIAWLVGNSLYRQSWFTGVLKTKALQFLGLISYSLYLWQELFTAHPSAYLADSWLLFSPGMFLFAATSYYLIERPCVRFAKRLLATSPQVRTG